MSEMKMNYIFIEKENQDSISMCEQIAELLGVEDSKAKSGNLPMSGSVCAQNEEVLYEISGKSGADQYFLELSTKARVNRAATVLQTLDDAIYKSPKQKYYTAIRVYDGISESYCKRLYPKYAEFERLLRALVSLIVTKAYGSAWREETVPEEMMADLKKNARGNLPISETLEQMDLSTLEEYLFAEREVVYEDVVTGGGENANGTAGKITAFEQLSKEELCRLLKALRPTSLWERHFESLGSQKKWKEKIVGVHPVRNKVAHQKRISGAEYKQTTRKLQSLNRDLKHAIGEIQKQNFTDVSRADMLGSFVDVLENIQYMTDATKAAASAISSVSSAIESVARVNAISPVTKSTQMIAEVLSDMRRGQQEVIAAVRPAAIAASMQKGVVSEVAKSLRLTQPVRDSIATVAKMSRLMNISEITKMMHGLSGVDDVDNQLAGCVGEDSDESFNEETEDHIKANSGENSENPIEAGSDENLEDKGDKSEDNGSEDNKD